MDNLRIAVVGATGLVGQELIRILEERGFPVSNLNLWAADGSGGEPVYAMGQAQTAQPIAHASEHNLFRDTDLAFFAAGDEASRHWARQAVHAGTTVIDGSPVFRMEADVPLVVPEVNPEAMESHQGIIASPNCSAVLLNIVLYPLYKANPIKKVVVSTYQSASGLGLPGMNELTQQTQQILAGENPRPIIFPHEIGFNILPQVDVFMDSGYTKEEWQLMEETRKILQDVEIPLSATCARVPILKGHCEAITVEFANPINPDTAGDILAEAPGIRLMDDTTINLYPQPRIASGSDMVLVGRLRQDAFNENGLVMWVAGDNVRKGSALNMVQIAEELNKRGWLKPKGQR